MDPNRDLNAWALTNACQRLTDLARALSQDRQRFDAELVRGVAQWVQRATDALEKGPAASGLREPAPARKGLGGLLSRVLKATESDSPPEPPRDEDAPPTAGHTLALRGHHQMIATPDLVTFLSAQRKTGVLEVATTMEHFNLEFDNGDIVHAQSSRTPEGQRLGDILVSSGAIDREALEQVMRTTSGGRLGEKLISMQLVPQEQFLDALRLQIQWLFQRLFEQPSQHFTFWSGPPIHADSNVRLNATALLLDGARAFDEGNWIARIATDQVQPEPPAPTPAPNSDWMNVAGS